jgi:putative N6-adenine-specific DNA methylase
MTLPDRFDIFLSAPPGLETVLRDEALACGFSAPKAVTGGVVFAGRWREVWRANLLLRGASHVLARVGSFEARHLSQLDKRAREIPWRMLLRSVVPVRVEASCSGSRLYHSGAVAERIATAIHGSCGAPVSDDALVCVKARVDNDVCTLSVDTSGEVLHKRGAKAAVGKAPMRETTAALLLRACGYTGEEPVIDPMCGSGTFVIEAAEMALNLAPGRNRTFAFEQLACFDAAAWAELKNQVSRRETAIRFHGSDRDAGAITMSRANAVRAGVAAVTSFSHQAVSALARPEGPAGLVMVNPPYGARIGERKALFALYGALGKVLRDRFPGWRIGLVTSDAGLARATGLPFRGEPLAFLHGGLRVKLFRCAALP